MTENGKAMEKNEFRLSVPSLGYFDTTVCGGGFAGVAAALSAAKNGAKVLLVESGGVLGGDITKGIVPQLLDPIGKGGLVRDIFAFLNSDGHTSARHDNRFDESGKHIPGTVVDLEYVGYYLEKRCAEAGVTLLYHSLVSGCESENGKISRLLITSEDGCFTVTAHTYIDATGNGTLAAMFGCKYECGHPETGEPQPAGSSLLVFGIPDALKEKNSLQAKTELKRFFADHGIPVSAEGILLIQSAVDDVWLLHFNSQFKVFPDSPFALSKATSEARIECVEFFNKIRKLPGFSGLRLLQSSSHIGIREGRRIFGKYRLTYNDIIEGRRFEDGICLVRFPIDVHRISSDDDIDHSNGNSVKPYHIPFRALIPNGCVNLLLAGRCISGDFYSHASYRVVGNVIPTGEAAGYASAVCLTDGCEAGEVSGLMVSNHMRTIGYEL